MNLQAAPHYVLVKCSIKEQSERQEKIGSIIIPETEKYMIYNMEWGEIISIGRKAHKNFPQMKVGYTAIMHHFVQGESKNESRINHLVHEDRKYRYYAITTQDLTSDSFSRRNETYGIWDGKKIIPHPDFIFLKYEEKKQAPQKFKKRESGIILFENWTESNEDLTLKMDNIKKRNLELSKTTRLRDQVNAAILKNEEEMEKISMKINSKNYVPHIIEYAPSTLSDKEMYSKGKEIFIQSNACQNIVTYKDKKFRIGLTKYLGGIRE